MKKLITIVAIATGIFLTSCTNINRSMREPNTRLNLEKKDFSLSDQVTGEATSTKILSIDWNRLFLKESGSHNNDNLRPSLPINFASIPVIGGFVMDPTAGYALYDMMKKNPGYDVVLYPQYEATVKRPIGLGFLYKITTVKATARLGKLNK
ncbi:MAG: hypothetical protein Q8T03_14200 [Bacteroidota bacterium]|nr:hypothetical protein [Bacteroidota bacterium]